MIIAPFCVPDLPTNISMGLAAAQLCLICCMTWYYPMCCSPTCRCRILHEKYLEWSPANCHAWIKVRFHCLCLCLCLPKGQIQGMWNPLSSVSVLEAPRSFSFLFSLLGPFPCLCLLPDSLQFREKLKHFLHAMGNTMAVRDLTLLSQAALVSKGETSA